jgi:uncharacterized protein (TIGR01777 family)
MDSLKVNMFNILRRPDIPEPGSMFRVVIPGGSGQIGRALARHFHDLGHTVSVLSRHPRPEPWRTISWDGCSPGDWVKEINGASIVINLAGRSVNCRYSPANRQEIMNSRIQATKAIGEAIAQAVLPPKLWMNASTATIYRHSFDRAMDEFTGELGGSEPDAPKSWHFSIDVATRWEQTFFEAQTPATRKLALRTAIVMAPAKGGTFAILRRLVRTGLGGKAGSGRQFVSWIHETDLIRAIDFLVAREDLDGCVNLSAPVPLPNADFMQALRSASRMPVGLPAPQWMLEAGAFFLRTESELLLKSRRVVPARLLGAGFEFLFPGWRAAAADLVRRSRASGTDVP